MQNDKGEQSAPEVITVDGNAFVKNSDGSLIKLNSEEYDESSLIYRWNLLNYLAICYIDIFSDPTRKLRLNSRNLFHHQRKKLPRPATTLTLIHILASLNFIQRRLVEKAHLQYEYNNSKCQFLLNQQIHRLLLP